MKVAPKVILLFKDGNGISAAMADALQPNPSSNFQRLEVPFELSLQHYGIKDRKASGKIVHFVQSNGLYEVSVLLLDNYEPPILACALNEVLMVLKGDDSCTVPTVVAPFIVPVSKLKVETKSSTISPKVSTYGLQVGPETGAIQALGSVLQKPPSALQIHEEHLACFLQLARFLKIPTLILLGQSGQHLLRKTSDDELVVVHDIGEHLAKFSSLCFIKERIAWNPSKSSGDSQQPWRALYG